MTREEIQMLRRMLKLFLTPGMLLFGLAFGKALLSGAKPLNAFAAGLDMMIVYIIIWIVALIYFLICIKRAEKK